jgi:hypothetical protein
MNAQDAAAALGVTVAQVYLLMRNVQFQRQRQMTARATSRSKSLASTSTTCCAAS